MNKFEEYKLFVESTQHLLERRQESSQIYLAVNTAIFAVLAFLVKDAGFRSWGLVLISVPLFIVGLVVCVIWHRSITQYSALIAWRFDQLMGIEKSQLLEGLHQFYLKEKEDFLPTQGKDNFSFSQLELWLPRLFLSLYCLYGVGVVVATAMGFLN
jgi:hypothetical protein